jgi:hypothetical protein
MVKTRPIPLENTTSASIQDAGPVFRVAGQQDEVPVAAERLGDPVVLLVGGDFVEALDTSSRKHKTLRRSGVPGARRRDQRVEVG